METATPHPFLRPFSDLSALFYPVIRESVTPAAAERQERSY